MTLRAAIPTLALAALPVLVMPAGAADVSGTLTLTGTDGREAVVLVNQPVTGGRNEILVTPPLAAGASAGECTIENDPFTARPVRQRCIVAAAGLSQLNFDLRGGDDVLNVVFDRGVVPTASANGGAGNDTLTLAGPPSRQFISGTGDDTIAVPGVVFASDTVSVDSGGGRDLVDYGNVVRNDGAGRPELVGIRANLSAAVPGTTIPATGGGSRTDTYKGVTRISGTPVGDFLTGSIGNDELIGGAGPDVIDAGPGADIVSGGDGNDSVAGGTGADTVDGGPGADDFINADGGDTINSRDGVIEVVACVRSDVIIDDLVDKLGSPANCSSVQTAAARHRFDTRVSGRAPQIGPGNVLRVRMSCPSQKTESCAGTLAARLGGASGKVLAARRYRIAVGRRKTAALVLTDAEAASARGRKLTLQADETDDTGRPRQVVRHVRAGA